MEFIFSSILLTLFVVAVTSSIRPLQYDQKNLIYYQENSKDTNEKVDPLHFYYYPLKDRTSLEDVSDRFKFQPEKESKYKYEPNQPEFDFFETNRKEKKQGHFETLCINIPFKRNSLEENGYDFKPNALVQHKCEQLNSEAVLNPLLIPDNAQICKVQGGCHTRHREVTIFKKQRNSTEGHCWEKENRVLSIGCQCIGHIFQPFA